MNQTIFSNITSLGGAIIAIRISGSDCSKFFEYFNIDFSKIKPRFSHLITLEENKNFLDEVILTYYNEGASFTGEETIELNIHGSKYIFERLMKILSTIPDFRLAKNGEFTKRALLNDKINLIKAESINQLIISETESEHHLATKFFNGESYSDYSKLRDSIIEILSIAEALIDFSDEDLPIELESKFNTLKDNLKTRISEYIENENLRKIRDGISIAIIGPTNSGKSSLINLLSKDEVSIVSNIHGTTRDVVSSTIIINGCKAILYDTAGIRNETSDEIEKIGIQKALKVKDKSDIKLFIFDINDLMMQKIKISDFSPMETDIVILNKIDTIQNQEIEKIKSQVQNLTKSQNIFPISIQDQNGIQSLVKTIEQKVENIKNNFKRNTALNERHFILLSKSLDILETSSLKSGIEIFAEDMKIIMKNLNELIGDVQNNDILDKIFNSFCIGK